MLTNIPNECIIIISSDPTVWYKLKQICTKLHLLLNDRFKYYPHYDSMLYEYIPFTEHRITSAIPVHPTMTHKYIESVTGLNKCLRAGLYYIKDDSLDPRYYEANMVDTKYTLYRSDLLFDIYIRNQSPHELTTYCTKCAIIVNLNCDCNIIRRTII